MKKADYRVLLAEDAIKHIKSGKFRINSQRVLKLGINDHYEFICDHGEEQLKDVLEYYNCDVCIRGGLLASAVLRYDEFLVKDVELYGCATEENKTDKYLSKWFSVNQLRTMERLLLLDYYEEGEDDEDLDDYPVSTKELKWRDKYPDVKDRALAIFKNIIKNKGTFKLESR